MVLVHSRKDTTKTAGKLVELARKNEDLELFRNDEHPQFALIKKEVMKSRNKDLVELFENGAGVHHAGMLRADRGLTERLFSDGLLKVLVCTATLAWGENLPAHIAVIKARTSHAELLDLKPLPVSSLWNNTYEALYNFSHINPVQMQIFHILCHTDNNVLLGARTGSGKTISAELAMLRLFNTPPDMKVVYIAPLKAIVGERMNDWRKHLVAQLGKKMVKMTGDYTLDLMALLSHDIIISTPEKWDGIARNWHSRSYGTKVGLVILDEIHLLGADRGPILEVFQLLWQMQDW